MLATNVDVSDGPINGAGGEVVHVVTSNDHKVTHILVTFDNPDVGAKAKQSSQYRHQYSDTVPLINTKLCFQPKGGGYLFTIPTDPCMGYNYPLDEFVVDMKGSCFNPGQAYVALSHVKKLEGYT